jgi:ankyrin repeat protein
VNSRIAAIVGLAAVAALSGGHAPRAQINPFGGYYENVARAAKQNDSGTVRLLLGNGTNPNQSDEEARTGLHYAALNGNLRIIAILIKAGAKLDPKEKLGNTPLHLAAERDQVEAARLLLDAGAAVDPENKNGMTPLMMAASRGNVEIVNTLLAKGANVAKTDYTGRDVAGWAADGRRPAVIQAIKRAQSAKKS